MTHKELVERAVRWLKGTRGCGVVLAEHTAGNSIPDAIGWRAHFSVLVECKVSRADFFADQKKPSRRPGAPPLAWKAYYLVPPGLVSAAEVPEPWGLLYAQARKVGVVKHAVPCHSRPEQALLHEIYRLYCEVRRYHVQGLRYQTRADWLRANHARRRAERSSVETPSVD